MQSGILCTVLTLTKISLKSTKTQIRTKIFRHSNELEILKRTTTESSKKFQNKIWFSLYFESIGALNLYALRK